MEDPIAPEDEITLNQHVELLQYRQGELNLNTYRPVSTVNPFMSDLQNISPQNNGLNPQDMDLQSEGNTINSGITTSMVNPENSDALSPVKQDYTHSIQPVTPTQSDSRPSKSDKVSLNVNKLELLIDQLKQLKHHKRNYQQILEPIIFLREDLLEDYHSTKMLYKVLKVVFPDYTDIYVAAVEHALIAYSLDTTVNRGAIFVKTLRQLADKFNLDLGFKSSKSRRNTQQAFFDLSSDEVDNTDMLGSTTETDTLLEGIDNEGTMKED